MNEQLKKLGLRLRHRKVGASIAEKAGRIGFDDRGNAQFEWNPDLVTDDSPTGERLRDQALEYAGLSIADDEAPPAGTPIRSNPKGLRLGYNPYESGLLAKKEWKRKRDLRELSRWIDLKRKLKDSGEK